MTRASYGYKAWKKQVLERGAIGATHLAPSLERDLVEVLEVAAGLELAHGAGEMTGEDQRPGAVDGRVLEPAGWEGDVAFREEISVPAVSPDEADPSRTPEIERLPRDRCAVWAGGPVTAGA